MKISDKSIGGTYLTLLNTISNFGGTWPKSPILFIVDWLTVSYCEDKDGNILGRCSTGGAGASTCSSDLGGTCKTQIDGFYLVAGACLIFGIFFSRVLKKKYVPLQKLKETTWLVSRTKPKTSNMLKSQLLC